MYRKTIILALTVISFLVSAAQEEFNFSPQQKLLMAEKIIETYYVDSVPRDKIVDNAIIGMLRQLDPHSVYTDAEQTRDFTTALDGNFSGIGISFNMQNDTLYVISTIAGGPSEKVGIRAGDRILMADDSIISGVKRKNSSVMSILRGEKGTKVRIKVMRRSEPEPLYFTVVRDNIPVESIAASFMAASSTGYIRLSRFAEKSDDEIRNAVDRLRKQGMKTLILDLTDNSGGHLNSAIEIAGGFLPKKSVIVSTKVPKIGSEMKYVASKGGGYADLNVIVMVNQFSASASEIVSGALQDYDRAVIVGRRTFGKGLVQRPFPFPDGSMIRVTVSRYYTPSGRLIQKPYKEGASNDYNLELYKRIESGEYFSEDSVHFDSSLKTKTLNRGRTIYGGGGIMPDFFVPVDTTSSPPVLRKLIASGEILDYAQSYADLNRERIKEKYPDEDLFIKEYEIEPSQTADLFKKTVRKDSTVLEEEFVSQLPVIKRYLKASIGRQLYSQNLFFKMMMPVDPIYKKAVELSEDPEKYRFVMEN